MQAYGQSYEEALHSDGSGVSFWKSFVGDGRSMIIRAESRL
jgi:hypothetical protein